MSVDTVAAGTVVEMHYTLKNPQGEVIDTSQGREPMPYLHGAQNIVPGLERQLTGLKVGASTVAIVPPEEGYGLRNEEATMVLPRSAFPGDMPMEPGTPFAMEHPQQPGGPVHCFIVATKTENGEELVLVDANHPLAGVELHFEVQIVSAREATNEEKAQGHPNQG